jgi:hypothetical protein
VGVKSPEIEADSKSSKTPVGPEAVGGVIALAPPPLSDLVTFERRPGPPELRELSSSQVVASLLRYSFNHYKRPADAFALTTDVARICRGWVLGYDRPEEGADLLSSKLT